MAGDADRSGLLAGAAFFFSGRRGFSTFGVRVETAFFDVLGSEFVEDGSDDGAGATAAGAGSGAGFGRCANPG